MPQQHQTLPDVSRSGIEHHTAGFGTEASHVTTHAIDDGTHPGAVLLTSQTGSAAGAVVGGASGAGAGVWVTFPHAARISAAVTRAIVDEALTASPLHRLRTVRSARQGAWRRWPAWRGRRMRA
jgi:hypothetical protein